MSQSVVCDHTLSLHKSPFWVLGATTRDSKRRIIELADEKSLTLDPDLCQECASVLTNPRRRLRAEMEWLPGVAPARVANLCNLIGSEPLRCVHESGLPPLARLNLLAAGMEAVDQAVDSRLFVNLMLELCRIADRVDPEQVQRSIDEERSVAGFQSVGIDAIQLELEQIRGRCRQQIRDALNRLPPDTLVNSLTEAVELDKSTSQEQGSGLLHEVVDAYEVETSGFLEREATRINEMVAAVVEAAPRGQKAVAPLLEDVEEALRAWCRVARPIQLSKSARGLSHGASSSVGFAFRGMGIDLFNKHDLLDSALRITEVLQEEFSGVVEIQEKTAEDLGTLHEMQERKNIAEKKGNEWSEGIKFKADIGLFFKDPLSISIDGVQIKGRSYPLESISRLRWGAVKRSVNGIPTGTSYTIGVGDNVSESVITTRNGEIFTGFTDKIWKAVGARLMLDMLNLLKSGSELSVGSLKLRDDGAILTKRKFLSASEKVHCAWSSVKIWGRDGKFYVRADEAKAWDAVPYITTWNVHFVEHLIRMAFNKGAGRLSDLLS